MTATPETTAGVGVARGSVVGTSGSLPRIAGRLTMRRADVAMVHRASGEIEALGAELDRRLLGETRPAERLRMIRVTTNQITRVANDAINAYARASRAVKVEELRPDPDRAAAREMRARLDDARTAMLAVLEVARRRYVVPAETESPAPTDP